MTSLLDQFEPEEQAPAQLPAAVAEPVEGSLLSQFDTGEEDTPILDSIPEASPPSVEEDVSLGDRFTIARTDISRSAVNTFADMLRGVALQKMDTLQKGIDKARDPSFLGVIGPGALPSEMTGQALQSLGVEDVPDVTLGDVLNDPLFKAGDTLESVANEFFPNDPRLKDSFQRSLASGAGSMAAFLATGLAGPVATALAGAGANSSSQFRDALLEGASLEDAFKAANVGAAVGTTEALPISALFNRLNNATGGLFDKVVSDSIKSKLGPTAKVTAEGLSGAIEEALQEGFVELMNNVSASDIVGYDEDRGALEGTGESAQVGGILGFVLSSIGSARGASRQSFERNRAIDRTRQDVLKQLGLTEEELAPAVEEEFNPGEQGTLDGLDVDPLEGAQEQELPLNAEAVEAEMQDLEVLEEQLEETIEPDPAQQVLDLPAVPHQQELDLDAPQQPLPSDRVREQFVPETPDTGRGNTQFRNILPLTEGKIHVVGEPNLVEVSEDGSAISANGRTYSNPNRDKGTVLTTIPKWGRAIADTAARVNLNAPLLVRAQAATVSKLRAHSAATRPIIKSMFEAAGREGRKNAQISYNAMRRIEAGFKRAFGKNIADASREELRVFNDYLHNRIDSDTFVKKTGVSEELLNTFDDARQSIKWVSEAMVQEGAIPAELVNSFEENAGGYLHVSYALHSLLEGNNNAAQLLENIPATVRNSWMQSFTEAYLDPIANGEIADMSRRQLKTLANRIGLVRRTETEDNTTIEYIYNDDSRTPIDSLTKEDLYNLLSEATVPVEEVDNYMLRVLQASGDAQGVGGGGDKSIQRERLLGRSDEQFRKAGYSEKEIQQIRDTRELMMEVVDPVTNIGITMQHMMNTLLGHRLLNSISYLEQAGLVSIGKTNPELGHTQALVTPDGPLGDIRIRDPQNPKDFVFAAPQSGSSSDGIYTDPETAALFNDLLGLKAGTSFSFADFLRVSSALTKMNLTAFNPSSHPRNAISAGLIALMRGHAITDPRLLTSSMQNAMRVVGREVFRNDSRTGVLASQDETIEAQREMDTFIEYLTGLGLVHDSVRTGPARDLLARGLAEENAANAFGQNTWFDMQGKPLEGLAPAVARSKSKVVRAGKEAAKRAAGTPLAAFRMEDEAMKVYAFLQERESFAKITGQNDLLDIMQGNNPNPTTEQMDRLRTLDKSVATHITNVYPTYSKVPDVIKFLSRQWFMSPFPSFNAEMVRNEIHDLKDLSDLVKGTGRYEGFVKNSEQQKKVIAKRMIAKYIYYTGVVALQSSIHNLSVVPLSGAVSDEDRERGAEEIEKLAEGGKSAANHAHIDRVIRAMMPDHLKESLYQIVDFKPGQEVTVGNLDFTLPNSQILAVGNDFLAVPEMIARGEGLEAAETILNSLIRFGYDYVKPDVIFTTMDEVMSGKTASGYRIWDERTMSDEEIAWAKVDHAARVMLPPGRVLRQGEKWDEALDRGELGDKLRDFVMGVNNVTYRFDTLLTRQISKIKKGEASFDGTTTAINRLISSSDIEMSDEEFTKKYLKLEERRKERAEEARSIILSAEAAGMTRTEVRKALENQGIKSWGDMSFMDIYRGRYKPLRPDTAETLGRFRAKNYARMTPEERREASRDARDTIRHRLQLIRDLRTEVVEEE